MFASRDLYDAGGDIKIERSARRTKHTTFEEFVDDFAETVELIVDDRSGGSVPSRIAEVLNPKLGFAAGNDQPRLEALVAELSLWTGELPSGEQRREAKKVLMTIEKALAGRHKNVIFTFVAAARRLRDDPSFLQPE